MQLLHGLDLGNITPSICLLLHLDPLPFCLQLREGYLKNEPMANRGQTYVAIRKLMSSLDDPFTRFLEPSRLAALRRGTAGQTGCGIVNSGLLQRVVVKCCCKACCCTTCVQIWQQVNMCTTRLLCSSGKL